MMKKHIVVKAIAVFFLTLAFFALYSQEGVYKVPSVYLPELVRPGLKLNKEALDQNYMGFLPEYDGLPFQLNRKGAPDFKDEEGARKEIGRLFKQVGLNFDVKNLVPEQKITGLGMRESQLMREYNAPYENEFQDRLNRKLGKLNSRTTAEVRKNTEEMEGKTRKEISVFPFRQQHQGIFLENTKITYVVRPKGLSSVNGNVFSIIEITNKRVLNADAAAQAARKHVAQYAGVKNVLKEKGEMVLLPYARGFKYAWKLEVVAEDGPYMLWIDAENGKILQLLPLFYYDSAQGLAFNPDPIAGTILLNFEVDPPAGGRYYLTKTGMLAVTSAGADGCSGNVSIADAGTGFADFNVAPLNGTVVERTSMTGYNCRFQEINTYAQIYRQLLLYDLFGSQPIGQINVTVNTTTIYGLDNAVASGNYLTLGLGSSTKGTSFVCDIPNRNFKIFNTAIDNTISAHELGHIINRLHYGGTLHGSVNEGLADFWSCTMFNLDINGRWIAKNCTSDTESGYGPRLADAGDIFPEHRTTPDGDREIHSDGQMLNWAMWNMRREYLDASALGAIASNIELLQAMLSAGTGITAGISDRRVHDAFADLERQLVANSGMSRNTHKILSGFARAGIFLSDREAIIDIDDDYLNRNLATTPVFTVWTGRDYTFDASGNAVTTGTLPFNTDYEVEVANDAAFTLNYFSSGNLSGVVARDGGTATWTLPAAMWNALKSGDKLYYKVTTRSSAGTNVRTSDRTGDGTVGSADDPIETAYAVINESGECECTTTTSGDSATGSFPALPALLLLLPVIFGVFRMRQLRGKGQ